MPAISLYISTEARDEALPSPKPSLPGFFFASAVSSAMDFTGSDGCTVAIRPAVPISETGAKSFCWLYGRVLKRLAFAALVVLVPISSV